MQYYDEISNLKCIPNGKCCEKLFNTNTDIINNFHDFLKKYPENFSKNINELLKENIILHKKPSNIFLYNGIDNFKIISKKLPDNKVLQLYFYYGSNNINPDNCTIGPIIFSNYIKKCNKNTKCILVDELINKSLKVLQIKDENLPFINKKDIEHDSPNSVFNLNYKNKIKTKNTKTS